MTPRLMVGTEEDAATLGFVFVDGTEAALRLVADDEVDGVVVPTPSMAEAILRHLGADHDWIRSHLHTDWAAEDEADEEADGGLWASFLRTLIRVFFDDSITEIVIHSESAPPIRKRGPLVHVITSWNPRSTALAPDENDRRQHQFEEQLDRSPYAWVPAAGVAEDGMWAEASAAITGMARGEAMQIGRQWDQEAIFEWDPAASVIAVVSCVDDRLTVRTCTTRGLPSRPCPMRPPGDPSEELCKRAGGGWTARSMEVAAEFDVRRRAMLRALGCDVCRGEAVLGAPGKPVLVVPVHDPSGADPTPWTQRQEPTA